MRIGTYVADSDETWGIILDDRAIALPPLLEAAGLPSAPDIRGFLSRGGTAQMITRVLEHSGAASSAVPLSEIRLRAPIPNPSKIVCIGLNFEDYRQILGLEYLAVPQMFLKAPSAVIGPDETVEIPEGYGEVFHEFEIAAVVGRRVRGGAREAAREAIFGYTIIGDLVLHDIELLTREYQQWAKNCDTFAPTGPWIATADQVPIERARMVRRRNGRLECESSTAQMRRPFEELIAFVSTFTTLEPGDMVTSASPPAGPFEPGDVIEAEVEGIGVLRNPVVSRQVERCYARALGY